MNVGELLSEEAEQPEQPVSKPKPKTVSLAPYPSLFSKKGYVEAALAALKTKSMSDHESVSAPKLPTTSPFKWGDLVTNKNGSDVGTIFLVLGSDVCNIVNTWYCGNHKYEDHVTAVDIYSGSAYSFPACDKKKIGSIVEGWNKGWWKKDGQGS